MKHIKKYIPATPQYLLSLYALLLLFVFVLTALQSCPSHPISRLIGPAILGPSLAFIIISPLFGLTFTANSFSAVKFYLPFKYIKNITVDRYHERITILYCYHQMLGSHTSKEHKATIHLNRYKTTLNELLQYFPAEIPVIYEEK